MFQISTNILPFIEIPLYTLWGTPIIIISLLYSCAEYATTKHKKNKHYYSSKGFALIYEDHLFEKKIISKKYPKEDSHVIHNFLKKGTIIQITNPECSIGSYPYFNYIAKTGGVNIVISSWTLDHLDGIVKEIKNMISLLGGKSSIVW